MYVGHCRFNYFGPLANLARPLLHYVEHRKYVHEYRMHIRSSLAAQSLRPYTARHHSEIGHSRRSRSGRKYPRDAAAAIY